MQAVREAIPTTVTSAQRTHYPIIDTTLANGLRLLVNPDPLAPGVAVNLWYGVGSRDETVGATGFAHLFEHLMFAGSAQVASGEHLTAIQAVGGSANATTGFDRTNYFQTVGPQALELALWLESERMSSLRVDEENFTTQREVVKEEKRQRYDNVPYGDQLMLLLELNFPAGYPYRHAPIGSMADLDAATLTDVQAFHQRWYHPGNATLALSGAVEVETAHELVGRYFGQLPAGTPAGREQCPTLPPHHDHAELTVQREVPRPMLHLGWRTPALDHPDRLALDIALALLGDGRSARLNRDLVRERQLAEGIGCLDLGLARGSSLAVISARPREDVELSALTEPILAHLERLAANGPDTRELARAKAGIEREWLAGLAPVDRRADQLNFMTGHFDDPERINHELDEILAIGAEQVAQATRTWLHPEHCSALRYLIGTTR